MVLNPAKWTGLSIEQYSWGSTGESQDQRTRNVYVINGIAGFDLVVQMSITSMIFNIDTISHVHPALRGAGHELANPEEPASIGIYIFYKIQCFIGKTTVKQPED